MENKNNVALFSIVFLVVGIFIGWLIWGNRPMMQGGMMQNQTPMHQMPNGSMMHGESMSMHDMMEDMQASLEGKTGDAFDKAFLSEMIIHHEGAVAMAEMVKATSKRPELLKLADDIITAQTQEIEMMQAWQKAWFK